MNNHHLHKVNNHSKTLCKRKRVKLVQRIDKMNVKNQKPLQNLSQVIIKHQQN